MTNDSLNAITEENLVEDIAADICDTVSRLNGIAYTPKQWMGTARNALAHFKYHSGKTSEIRLDFEDVKKAATAIHAASQKLHGCSILNSTCLIYAEAALMATHKPMSLKDIIRKVKFTYDFSNETTPETAVQIVLDAAGVRYVD